MTNVESDEHSFVELKIKYSFQTIDILRGHFTKIEDKETNWKANPSYWMPRKENVVFQSMLFERGEPACTSSPADKKYGLTLRTN